MHMVELMARHLVLRSPKVVHLVGVLLEDERLPKVVQLVRVVLVDEVQPSSFCKVLLESNELQ